MRRLRVMFQALAIAYPVPEENATGSLRPFAEVVHAWASEKACCHDPDRMALDGWVQRWAAEPGLLEGDALYERLIRAIAVVKTASAAE